MADVEQGNIARLERARARGEATFTREVVDRWPACTTCGTIIRHRGGERVRRCRCPRVHWRVAAARGDGWLTRVDEAAEAGGRPRSP